MMSRSGWFATRAHGPGLKLIDEPSLLGALGLTDATSNAGGCAWAASEAPHTNNAVKVLRIARIPSLTRRLSASDRIAAFPNGCRFAADQFAMGSNILPMG